MGELKKGISIDELCKGIPTALVKYMHYCKNLGFTDKPDYVQLKKLIRSTFEKTFSETNFSFDWVINKINLDDVEKCSPKQDLAEWEQYEELIEKHNDAQGKERSPQEGNKEPSPSHESLSPELRKIKTVIAPTKIAVESKKEQTANNQPKAANQKAEEHTPSKDHGFSQGVEEKSALAFGVSKTLPRQPKNRGEFQITSKKPEPQVPTIEDLNALCEENNKANDSPEPVMPLEETKKIEETQKEEQKKVEQKKEEQEKEEQKKQDVKEEEKKSPKKESKLPDTTSCDFCIEDTLENNSLFGIDIIIP